MIETTCDTIEMLELEMTADDKNPVSLPVQTWGLITAAYHQHMQRSDYSRTTGFTFEDFLRELVSHYDYCEDCISDLSSAIEDNDISAIESAMTLPDGSEAVDVDGHIDMAHEVLLDAHGKSQVIAE